MNNCKIFIRNIISIGTLILVVMVSSCGHKDSKDNILSGSDTIPVKTLLLCKKELSLPVNASGQFITDDETFLSFKTGGIISDIFVKEGDFVKKGAVLASLDLTEIKSQASQAELGFEKVKRDYARVGNLYKDSVATLEQYQNVKTSLDVAKATLDGARFNLTYSQITAVTDGYILKKNMSAGQIVGPGTPILKCSGSGNNSWKFRAGLSDKEWSALAINDEAQISTDAFPHEIIKGIVLNKSQGADPVTGTFFVEIRITSCCNNLATGLYGKAVITPVKKSPFWAIPYEALLDGNAGQGFVFVTKDNKTAQKMKVSISVIGKDEVYVSNGLDNVQHLIVSGSAYLSDGSLIKVQTN